VKFTYDPRYNIAYIRFQKRSDEVATIKISEELNVDLASDGTVYGIELLNAKEQLARDRTGVVTVVNEATGEQTQVNL
jgi:uncharacterized protein YuzE